MGNENLQKIYADSTKKRTAQQTKWERAVEGLTFDRLEKKKIDYLLDIAFYWSEFCLFSMISSLFLFGSNENGVN